MKFLKQTTNKFLALGAFLLASVGICLSVGMVYFFVSSIWKEMQANPLDWTGLIVIVIIIVTMLLVATLIANIPKLIKFGIRKIRK
jgi:uncharacterized membrane protein YdbT with pleckstrin-like domain